MEDSERKEVAPVNATKTQNSGVLSFGETREDIVREMREGAALFADKGDRLFANVLAGFAKRVEALGTEGAHGGAPAKQGQETVTDCHGLGNVARLREALEKIERLNHYNLGCIRSDKARHEFDEKISEIERIAKAALAAPPRNCDVGTAEEQGERISEFCEIFPGISCKGCPLEGEASCELTWAQMPYNGKGGGHDAA